MENQTINQIVKELDRLCLLPIPGEQEGVDAFGVVGHPELVVLADQEVECLNAEAVLKALKEVETPDEDEDERETYERYGYAIQDLEDFDVEIHDSYDRENAYCLTTPDKGYEAPVESVTE